MLPTINDITQALEIYLGFAYPDGVPGAVSDKFSMNADVDAADWLMGEVSEKDPPSAASVEDVRSFALRLGNRFYPNMKVRLTRPKNHDFYLFSVDSHDAFLIVPPDSPDYREVEEMKKHNAKIVSDVNRQWDTAGLMTERTYLRSKIAQARARRKE